MITKIENLDDCASSIKWRLTDACNFHCSYCLRRQNHEKDQEEAILKYDYQSCLKAAKHVNRIAEELPGNTVKINLIGGEVSRMDLIPILKQLTTPKIKRVTITTNFSASVEYYANLAKYLAERGAVLGLTASWHTEFLNFEVFTKKVLQLKEATKDIPLYFKAELVSREDNQDDCERFREFCEAHKFGWIIDADLRNKTQDRDQLISGGSNKNPRYRVTFSDGTSKEYMNRNTFLIENGGPGQNAFKTAGYLCSRDYDYVYIERNLQVGRAGTPYCKNRQPVENFHVLKKPLPCPLSRCTLCGHISVSMIE